MHDLIRIATIELAEYLCEKLPQISDEWWDKNVVNRLSFHQQRIVQQQGIDTLKQLDFAALLRIIDQNWYELSTKFRLPREARSWVKELQTVRNKWAHITAEEISPSDIYRDVDTLNRLFEVLGVSQSSREAVESVKKSAIDKMKVKESSDSNNSNRSSVTGRTSESTQDSETLYKPGDLVVLKSDPNNPMAVVEAIKSETENRYKVFQNNVITTFYERQLEIADFNNNESRVLSAIELQAKLTSFHILSPSLTNLFSLRTGRIQFVPYQYRPVLKLLKSDRPRLLIADEVGVGKTIEAGLIIKELSARMELSSILIICPKALVAERKWEVEMKRFDERFTPLNGPMLSHCLRETDLDGKWPEQYEKAIIPFSLFDSRLIDGDARKRKRNRIGISELDPPPKFDLVIVDEAHHIRNSTTYLHQGVKYFCDNADAVLFLTATPVQLGSQDLFTLLNVLRPDLVIDHASFDQMAEPNRHINAAVQHCRRAKEGWKRKARKSLANVAETNWGQMFMRESPDFQEVYDRLQEESLNDKERVEVTREIEKMYTFGSLINRTRRRDIGEFTVRKPKTLKIEFTPAQKQLHDGVLNVVRRILEYCHDQQNVKFMMTTIRRQTASCIYGLVPLLQNMLHGKVESLELESGENDDTVDLSFVESVRADVEDLLTQAKNLDEFDPKAEAFLQVLKDKGKLANNKALVFSTFRHTLSYLAKHLQEAGIRYGVIHGDVPDDERAYLRRRFAMAEENPEAIDVLLSSEVGCEGLDFQFCNFLINYDLPWNPMRIEQRIGRIDRHGQQSETVAVVNFVTPDTVDFDIYERCLMRIGVFQRSIGGNEEILGKVNSDIHDIAENFNLTEKERKEKIQQIADNSIRKLQEEQKLESEQAKLFGLKVPNKAWEQEVKEAESYWLAPESLQKTVSMYLALRLESDQEYILGEKLVKTLRLNQEARSKLHIDYKKIAKTKEPVYREWERWLKGVNPTQQVTFDQETASENPETTHLSVVHPLIRQAANYLKFKDPVYTVLSSTSDKIPRGEYHFALYRWNKKGVKSNDGIVEVASSNLVEENLLELLQGAKETKDVSLPSLTVFNELDKRHYKKWLEAQASHIDENKQQVEHRKQSLKASHNARCKAIEDKINRATDSKILLMRQGELEHANQDYQRRIKELDVLANSGDIHFDPLVFGVIKIK